MSEEELDAQEQAWVEKAPPPALRTPRRSSALSSAEIAWLEAAPTHALQKVLSAAPTMVAMFKDREDGLEERGVLVEAEIRRILAARGAA